MSEFINYIYYRPGLKMGKPDGQFRPLGEEKSGIDTYHFDKGQLLNLHNDDIGEEEYMEYVELERIDVAT